MYQTSIHKSIIEFQANRPVRARDRNNTLLFEIEWAEDKLSSAQFRTPTDQTLILNTEKEIHPLFGICDTISLHDGRTENPAPIARLKAVDWANPATIPPLDQPGVLPPGSGTTLLNFIAWQAQQAGRSTLRYQGPYPTGNLFDALSESFRPIEDPTQAFQQFTARVEETALSGEMSEVPVDFAPAPFERVWVTDTICVQLRDGVEKVYIDGQAYSRYFHGSRRIYQTENGYSAVVAIAGTPWATRLQLDEKGNMIAGPYPLPSVTNQFVGRPIPDSIRAVLVEVLPAQAPDLIQEMLKQVLAETPIYWADTGDQLATITEGAITLHAVLLERLAGQSPEIILQTIAQAIDPVAQRLAQQRLVNSMKVS